VDTCGRVLGPEQAGEILVHSPVVMTGYFGGPKETAEALRGGGCIRARYWFPVPAHVRFVGRLPRNSSGASS